MKVDISTDSYNNWKAGHQNDVWNPTFLCRPEVVTDEDVKRKVVVANMDGIAPQQNDRFFRIYPSHDEDNKSTSKVSPKNISCQSNRKQRWGIKPAPVEVNNQSLITNIQRQNLTSKFKPQTMEFSTAQESPKCRYTNVDSDNSLMVPSTDDRSTEQRWVSAPLVPYSHHMMALPPRANPAFSFNDPSLWCIALVFIYLFFNF